MFLNIQPKPFLIQPEPQSPSYFRQPSDILPPLGQLDCFALGAGAAQWSALTSSSLAFSSSTFLVPWWQHRSASYGVHLCLFQFPLNRDLGFAVLQITGTIWQTDSRGYLGHP